MFLPNPSTHRRAAVRHGARHQRGFIFLPYRAKNPPDHFPYATISLIVINSLIFLLTINGSGEIRDRVLQTYGVSHNTLSIPRLFTAMFLHAEILHIAGNMLFLWIFGAPLEGRIGPVRYLALYTFSGLVGGLLSDLVVGIGHPDLMNLGASGAIFGLAGAYLYVFPFSTISCFYWWGFVRIGTTEWQARWVVLYYVGINILEALLFGGMDGVGHMAHLGGAGMGLLLVFVLGAQRDDEELSNVQAVRAETRDLSLLNLYELEALLQKPNPEPQFVLAYCEKALGAMGDGPQKCLAALQHHGRMLAEQGDVLQLADILLRLSPPMAKALPQVFYLRVGSRLERVGANEQAIRIYYLMGEIDPKSADYEVALFRLGRIAETAYGDPEQAKSFYTELLQTFPQGQMATEAHMALAKLSRPGGSAVATPRV